MKMIPSIVLVILAVLFLIPSAQLLMQGEPLRFTPAVAVGVAWLVAAIIAVVMGRKRRSS